MLRRRQQFDRVRECMRLIAQIAHPSRSAHLPESTRLRVAIHLRAAVRHLRAAETLLESGA